MPRPSVKVAALNIAIQDPKLREKASYAKIFELLAQIEPINVRAETFFVVRVTGHGKTDHLITGYLDQFTDVSKYPWYNMKTRRRVSREEQRQIRVPDGFSANFKEHPFQFNLRSHRLFFEIAFRTRSLSPLLARQFFESALSHRKIVKAVGSVAVSIEQKPELITRILRAEHLRELHITINRPNPDLGRGDEPFDRYLRRIKAKNLQLVLRADDEGAIEPDDTLSKAARFAASNGAVDAKVFEDGRVKPLSTEEHPVVETQSQEQDGENPEVTFKRAADALNERLAKEHGHGGDARGH